MKTLELKHIAPYLPYELKCQDKRQILTDNYEWVDNCKIDQITPLFLHTMGVMSYLGLKNVKLILRPISDLNKEIEIEGKKFVPIDVIQTQLQKYSIFSKQIIDVLECGTNERKLNLIPYAIYQKLFEWHFDVFGLIEEGLAVDINTLIK